MFGPSDGRNVAFVSPSAWLRHPIDWVDDTAVADAALGRLILRYLAVFPGATKEMIARWWGGGRMSAINRALEGIATEVEEVDVEGLKRAIEAPTPADVTVLDEDDAQALLPLDVPGEEPES